MQRRPFGHHERRGYRPQSNHWYSMHYSITTTAPLLSSQVGVSQLATKMLCSVTYSPPPMLMRWMQAYVNGYDKYTVAQTPLGLFQQPGSDLIDSPSYVNAQVDWPLLNFAVRCWKYGVEMPWRPDTIDVSYFCRQVHQLQPDRHPYQRACHHSQES